MRSLNMIIGGLFVACGIIMIAGFNGITFLSVAFVLGLLFMIAGIMGCMSYRSNREDSVDSTWVVVDGATTFVLGFLIISNKLASDAAVPLVLGLWIAITGIRNLTRALEKADVRDSYFYGHLVIGTVNVVGRPLYVLQQRSSDASGRRSGRHLRAGTRPEYIYGGYYHTGRQIGIHHEQRGDA